MVVGSFGIDYVKRHDIHIKPKSYKLELLGDYMY